MGWIIAVALIVGCVFSKEPVCMDTIFLTSGLFAIAWSLSVIADKLTKKDNNTNK